MDRLFHISLRGDHKVIFVDTPSSDFQITVDNDDVSQTEVVVNLEKMLTILNDFWNDSRYARFQVETCPHEFPDDQGEWWEAQYEKAGEELERLLKEWK